MHGTCILYLPPNLLQQVFLQYFSKCSMFIEHPCAQVPLDYTPGYDPEVAQ